jgi:capsular exopolysaccharide synthesis family protein
MDLRFYLRVFAKRKLLVAVCVVLCAAGALGASLATIPVYQGSAKLLVVTRSTPGGGIDSAYQGTLLSQQLLKSFATMLESRATAAQALRRQPEPITPSDLEQRIHAQPIEDTLLIDLSVEDTDPDRAQRLTNSVAAAFIAQAPSLQGASALRVDLVEPALRPSAPVRPKTRTNLALGVLLGLMIGGGFAFLVEYLDTTIKGADDLEAAARAPVVGTIPMFDASAGKDPVPVSRRPRSPEAEAFRKLRTNFSFLGVDRRSLCCVVTSALPGEGKSTVTANLALALAQAGRRVAVVEADLRKPTVHELFAMQDRVGTTTVLLEQARLSEALQRLGMEPLVVLTSGQLPPNPSELLGSDHMRNLVDELRAANDVVLIDCTPLLPVTDPLVVSRFADGMLLVARAGVTTRDQVDAARSACDKAGAHVFGVVLNGTKANGRHRGSGYGYGAYASYGYDRREPAPVALDATANGTRVPVGRRSK